MSSPMKRSVVGQRSSARTMRVAFIARSPAGTTCDIWTRWSSLLPAGNTGCGAPSIRTVMCLTRSFRTAATPRRSRTEADDYRQVALLWCGASPDHAEYRTSIAQGPQQSRREFTRAITKARAINAAVPITGKPATLRLDLLGPQKSLRSTLAVDRASAVGGLGQLQIWN